MRRGTHMNKSRATNEWVMLHVWMSHVPHMYYVFPAYQPHVTHINAYATNINYACQTHERVIYHIWMSLTCMNATCFTWYRWVMLHIWKSHTTHEKHPSSTSILFLLCMNVCVRVCVNVWYPAICIWDTTTDSLLLLTTMPCDAVWCSVMQCVALCWSVMHCVAVWCRVMQCVVVWCSVMQCDAVCCSMMQRDEFDAVCCSVMLHASVRCSRYINLWENAQDSIRLLDPRRPDSCISVCSCCWPVYYICIHMYIYVFTCICMYIYIHT